MDLLGAGGSRRIAPRDPLEGHRSTAAGSAGARRFQRPPPAPLRGSPLPRGEGAQTAAQTPRRGGPAGTQLPVLVAPENRGGEWGQRRRFFAAFGFFGSGTAGAPPGSRFQKQWLELQTNRFLLVSTTRDPSGSVMIFTR